MMSLAGKRKRKHDPSLNQDVAIVENVADYDEKELRKQLQKERARSHGRCNPYP